jgi:hypothetical protein
MRPAGDFDAEPLGKQLDVLDEVAQKDELTEFVKRATGVSRQPVSYNFRFGFHDVGTHGIETQREPRSHRVGMLHRDPGYAES